MKAYKKEIISGFLIILGSLGLGRFAFGMILPNLQETLNLSSTQVGFIGTSNFIGYFIGIFFANYLYTKFSSYKLISSVLALQAIWMFLMVFFTNYLFISITYALSGLFCAIANISIMAYIANIVPKNMRGKALGIIVSGSGLAIIFSGQVVPFMQNASFQMPWKISWTIFCVILLLIAIISFLTIKKDTKHKLSNTEVKQKKYFKTHSFWKISFIYMIFGLSYSIFVTFFVSAVIEKYSFSSSLSGDFWTLLGFCSLFSGLVFGLIADRFGAYKSLIFVYLLQTIAHLILAIDINSYAIWISAICFGISVWSIPSLVTVLTSLHFDVKKTAQVLSLVTLLFALCQAIGPVLAGYIYDITRDFNYVFALTSLLTFVAIILSIIFSKQPIKQIH